MLRVGLDVSPLADAVLTGIPLSVENLLRQFAHAENAHATFTLVGGGVGEIAGVLHKRGLTLPAASFDFVPAADFRLGEAFPPLARSPLTWATRKIDGRVLLPVGVWETSRRVQKARCDVFHHTALLRVSRGAAPRHIVTIWDVSPRFFPETHNRVNRAEWERVFAFAQSRADLIITDSLSAKADVVEQLKINPDRVRAIPLGLRPLPAPLLPDEAQAVLAAHGLSSQTRFILSVGSWEPRKNLPRLVEAFAQIADGPEFSDVRLVLVGAKLHGSDAVSGAIARYNLSDRTVQAGYLSDAHVAHLLRVCAAFVYPSLYEGFGLPVLEALAAGAPTLASRASALPEVGGEAAAYFDPNSAHEIAGMLRRVLTDAAFADDLRARGPKRAALFSWQRCARAHLSAYRDVAGR